MTSINMEYKYSGTKLKIRRIPYYLRSIFILLQEIEPKLWLRFFIDLLLPKIKTVKLKKNKLVFQLKTWLDVLTLKEVVLDEEYEGYGVKIVERDRIIVDIGAGFGDFSILTAKKYPKTKIFAFEPDPFYFNLLRDNIRLNKVGNIIAYKKPITSLKQVSHLISSHLLQRIDFLKMDCEGCEFEIINNRGLSNLHRVEKLVMEYHENKNRQVSKIVLILEKTGFKVKFCPREQIENIGLLVATAL